MTHTDLAELSKAASGGNGGKQALKVALGTVDPKLAAIGDAFVGLQDQRHGADYDDDYVIDRASALAYVDDARQAITNADMLWREAEPSYQRFLGLAVGAVKVAKQR